MAQVSEGRAAVGILAHTNAVPDARGSIARFAEKIVYSVSENHVKGSCHAYKKSISRGVWISD